MPSNIQSTEILLGVVIVVVTLMVGAVLGIGVRYLLGRVGPSFSRFFQGRLGGILSLAIGIALSLLIGLGVLHGLFLR